MSTHIIPFEAPGALPAHIAQLSQVAGADDLINGAQGGFPIVSIKGKVFTIVRGDDRNVVTRPDSPDEPASAIEVVILKANKALSKNYFRQGYVEGTTDKPTCYSNDGIAPAADAQEPQSRTCAACPHNVWGSKITEQQTKGKACADSRRLAIAPVSQLNDVMLLRVPAASLKPLADYGDMLKKRGVPYASVVTKVSFDYTVAHPALLFKPVGFIDAAGSRQIQEVLASDLPAQIVGTSASPAPQVAPAAQPSLPPVTAPQPVAAAPVPPAPAEKPVVKRAKAAAPAAEAPKPAAPKAPAKPEVAISSDLEAELAKALASSGFDDA